MHAIGAEDAAEEVVPEYAVTKDVVVEAGASAALHLHHQLGTSREKWKILVQS